MHRCEFLHPSTVRRVVHTLICQSTRMDIKCIYARSINTTLDPSRVGQRLTSTDLSMQLIFYDAQTSPVIFSILVYMHSLLDTRLQGVRCCLLNSSRWHVVSHRRSGSGHHVLYTTFYCPVR
jgi:hypothetical protein